MKKVLKFIMGWSIIVSAMSQSFVNAYSDEMPVFVDSYLGDVNEDGVFTFGDVNCIMEYMTKDEEINVENANMNKDDVINITDCLILKSSYYEVENNLKASSPSEHDMESEVPVEYSFSSWGKPYTITVDPVELKAFNRINKFRMEYGVRKSQLHYSGHKGAELLAQAYYSLYDDNLTLSDREKIYNQLYNEASNFLLTYHVIMFRADSANVDYFMSQLTCDNVYKGTILRGDYNVSVGRYLDCWAVVVSYC